mmetsp:Transcript_26483/g.105997  ORF Transcript_26483/g.105997 Transcript_26483/m.105997 type:complete len:204 (-) Transcript_26483:152-763(-)
MTSSSSLKSPTATFRIAAPPGRTSNAFGQVGGACVSANRRALPNSVTCAWNRPRSSDDAIRSSRSRTARRNNVACGANTSAGVAPASHRPDSKCATASSNRSGHDKSIEPQIAPPDVPWTLATRAMNRPSRAMRAATPNWYIIMSPEPPNESESSGVAPSDAVLVGAAVPRTLASKGPSPVPRGRRPPRYVPRPRRPRGGPQR